MPSLIEKRIYAVVRLTLSAVWGYHGLVPKLIFKHPDEYSPLLAAGITAATAGWMVQAAGVAEIAAAVALIVFWRARSGFWITIFLMSGALVGVAVTAPRLLTAAFNPFSLNVCMIALSVIGLLIPQQKSSS